MSGTLKWLFVSLCVLKLGAQTPTVGRPPAAPGISASGLVSAQSTSSNWYVITNRAAIASAWNNTFAPTSTVPTGWTGSVPGNIPGATTQAFKAAVATRINWFRAMAGVPTGIAIDPTYSANDQAAALMFSANDNISHSPPSTWADYSAAGATAAANSNICIGYTDDPGCLVAYIVDQGSNNSEVGHRRWVLYPQTQTMGTGDVPQSGYAYPPANALWVFDGNYGGQRPATRDGYVAWPPPGYVPYQVAPPRWSFSYPNADFSSATVSMQSSGATIPVQIEPLANGYGENTLVWIVNNQDPNAYFSPSPPAADTTYTVAINNVMINGAASNFVYTVTVFNPATASAAVPSDFDGNGVPDLVWQNDSTGQAGLWYMGGSQGLTELSYAFFSPDGTNMPGWTLVTVHDMNGDGVPDLIWQNNTTRQVRVWYMGGTGGATLQGTADPAPGSYPGWRLAGVADMNGDGIPDLVWQNDSTRSVGTWYMGSATSILTIEYQAPGTYPGWTLVGVADMNQDGVPDLVWQNDTTRSVGTWYMSGPMALTLSSIAYQAPYTYAGWKVVGVADLNGDGIPDLLWQNDTTRSVGTWYMGGPQATTLLSIGYQAPGSYPGWRALGQK